MKTAAGLILMGVSGLFYRVEVIAQNESYADVLVVVNSNSTISDSIGSYFALNRNIPSSNIARISVPTTEEIDSLQFEDLRVQLEQIILTRNLQNQINYIVTTKGVPLKVLRSNSFTSSSVESELTQILGSYARFIGGCGSIESPYFGQQENFSHAKYGIYLVTRLDGYNFTDVKGIIDRASMATTSDISKGKVILNEDPLWNLLAENLNDNMNQASIDLQEQNVQTVLDTTSSFLMYQTGVLGYASWGSNDHNPVVCTNHAIPCNSYLPGAIAETYVLYIGADLFYPTNLRPISDRRSYQRRGDGGQKGTCMNRMPMRWPMWKFFSLCISTVSRWLKVILAPRRASTWMDVVIGDPKCRLNTLRLSPAVLPVNLTAFNATAIDGSVRLTWATAGETSNDGFEIERTIISQGTNGAANAEWQKAGFITGKGTTNVPQKYCFDDNVTPGRYEYRLQQIDNCGTFVLSEEVEAVVVVSADDYKLSQNFPNPFNPSTTISYSIPIESHVTLSVFNTLGQKVTELVNAVKEAGVYNVRFDAGGLASGIYLYRIQAGNTVLTRKLMLTK